MLDKLLAVATNNAKLALAAVAGAALVAGGSAVAITQVSDNTPSTPSVTMPVTDNDDATEANESAEHRSDTATATIPTPEPSESPEPSKSPKPSESPEPSKSPKPEGAHGACVSAVAHDKSKVGREHGKAVSEAAHKCPKGGDDAAAADPTQTQDAADSPDAAEHETADHETDTTDSGSGSHQSDRHGKSGSHKGGKD